MSDLFGAPDLVTSAVLSDCRLYRYRLSRVWDATKRPALFIGLNPSTADATRDDPTIRRCVGFARLWGAGGVEIINLFAWRATDPGELRHPADPVGPDNDRHVQAAAEQCHPIVAAWGREGAYRGRDAAVLAILRAVGVPVLCLGLTKQGQPRHPLYVKANAPLIPYPPASPPDASPS